MVGRQQLFCITKLLRVSVRPETGFDETAAGMCIDHRKSAIRIATDLKGQNWLVTHAGGLTVFSRGWRLFSPHSG
jgi:hypothetical protein